VGERRCGEQCPVDMALSRVPASMSASCSIFVGNVPYDAQEDELKELFGKVGNVTSVRLVLDKDTKTPKGYAFADFADPASVQAAVEKLNHVEYNGRKLRIDAAERELHNPFREDGPGLSKGKGGGKGLSIDPASLPKVDTIADKLQRKKEQEAAEKAKMAQAEEAQRAEVARLMETLTPAQVLHVLGEMQRLTLRAPDVARALLGENTQLGLALQHAQFLAGMLEDSPMGSEPEVRERARTVREKIWGVADTPGVGGIPPTAPVAPIILPGLPPGVMPLMMPGQPLPFLPPPGGFAPMGVPPMGMNLGVPMGARPMAPMAPMTAPMQPVPQIPQVPAAPAFTEEQKANMERLAQLPPPELEKLPNSTKVQLLEYLQTCPKPADGRVKAEIVK